MALLTRELELIIIARDHTAATTARVGGALTLIGTGITQMGLAWSREMASMTEEALQLRDTAALAFTQMFDRGAASVGDVRDAIRNVSTEVPAPMDELGEAIFDIFSSIEATVPEAELILREVARAAVAGGADVRTAMIPTIATMNAFGLSADDIGFILDQQFKTVQKGIITYDELAGNIGKVIPTAISAGQEVETMGAAFAFLTKSGLSPEMAATSVARAFELFAQPKTVKNLEEMGIQVRDSRGEFRQINDVLADMDVLFGGLSAPDRKALFIEIFGQGRIQARRFFDLAIPGWQEFDTLAEEFRGSAGAFDEAYAIMMGESPQKQLDLIKGRWMAVRSEIGDRFIPLLEEKVIPIADRLWEIWSSLDDTQKDNLARWSGIAGAAATVLGAFTTLLGIGKLLAGLFGTKGFLATAGAVGLPFLKFAGIAGLVAGAAILIWQNWDKVVDFFNSTLKPAIQSVIDFLMPFAKDIVDTATRTWDKFVTFLQGVWDRIKEVFENVIGPEFMERFQNLPEEMRDIWERVKEIVGPAVEFIKTAISTGFEFLQTQVEIFTGIFEWVWTNWGDEIMAVVRFAWVFIKTTIETTFTIIRGIFEFFTAILKGDWEGAWNAIKDTFIRIWDIIMKNTENVRKTITEWIQGVVDKVKEIWDTGWNAVKDFFVGIWDAIVEFFTETGDSFSTLWEDTWTAIKDFFTGIWDAIVEFFQGIWNNSIVQFIIDVMGIIREVIRIGWEFVQGIIKTVLEFIWNNIIQPIWNAVKDFLTTTWEIIKGVADTVWNAIKNFVSTSVEAADTTIRNIWGALTGFISGIWNGIKSVTITVWEAVKNFIIEKIRFVWDRVTYYAGLIRGVAEIVWGAIKRTTETVWNEIKDFIWKPIKEAYDSVSTWIGNIVGKIRELWNRATYWVGRVRDVLSKINPTSWFSPPLTQTVGRGMDTLKGVVVGKLIDIHGEASRRVANIRAEVRTLTELEEKRHRLQAAQLASSFSSPTTTSSPTTININTSDDPVSIADALSWQMRIQ